MRKAEDRCMKHQALGPRRKCAFSLSAMEAIAGNGMPYTCQVNSDLVCAPCLESRRDQRRNHRSGAPFNGTRRSVCGKPSHVAVEQAIYRRNMGHSATALDRAIDGLGNHISNGNRSIFAIHVVGFERVAEPLVGVPRPRKHQETAGEPV